MCRSRKERQARLDTLLDEFGIAHLANVSALALSGGERRRAEIARAVAADPVFMLLDEPFAGVDPIAVADVKALVRQLTRARHRRADHRPFGARDAVAGRPRLPHPRRPRDDPGQARSHHQRSRSPPRLDGDAHSSELVRHRIKEMIDSEPASDVLSDDKIVERLKQDGVDIARRTVAKYREALRIPSSVQRRRQKRIAAGATPDAANKSLISQRE